MTIDWHKRIADAKTAVADMDNHVFPDLPPYVNVTFPKRFDHTLLKPDATSAQVQKLCEEAVQYNFAAVCIRQPFVEQATEALKGTDVKVCSVVGFHDPTASTLEQKLVEAHSAVAAGAAELDMVFNWPALRQQEYDGVCQELRAMRDAIPKATAVLKAIFETSQLSYDEIIAACVLASEADFEFVKTSTGFLGPGANTRDVDLMYRICVLEGKGMAVKASGGIRTLQDATRMVESGAMRLGASASVTIMQEADKCGWNQ